MSSRKFWVWGPAFLLMVSIFLLSSMETLPESSHRLSDKIIHGFIYAILGAVVLRGFAGAQWSGVTMRAATLALIFSAIYGLSDEFHQRFVPGRFADVQDLIADVVGAFIGVVFVWTWGIVLSTQR